MKPPTRIVLKDKGKASDPPATTSTLSGYQNPRVEAVFGDDEDAPMIEKHIRWADNDEADVDDDADRRSDLWLDSGKETPADDGDTWEARLEQELAEVEKERAECELRHRSRRDRLTPAIPDPTVMSTEDFEKVGTALD